ncbi:TlyA family RNA methyltransferase [Cellulomonas denverensis]|uniref:TlyA family RNA methyltransferase n=1 Tax=Cellulomonas denverensis TaxID=264297 RepID=A0A7X6QYQ2_9CELL|nr:TlyA family RNA methyltransferase [Cellulomonas denverensis]NKY22372.1 TlyA family RNA methyltransferase [Cellulomonas denverensis]GIG25799.1 TlyA family rRNA (cytidine-2'-O)-methyltransferase [Cellulomonas denverensis]
MRVDAVLVRDGLARSRRHATELIESGRVAVDGRPVRRPSATWSPGQVLTVADDAADDGYASRGAYKLVGALDTFGVDPAGLRCLDAGASTGGFTDVLLRRGAASVVAVDVGHDQLVDRLRQDPRVEVHEGVNLREAVPGQFGPPPELVVADLSFISLTLVLPALAAVVAPAAALLVMVKPQFEVGRERLGSGGVVRSPDLRCEAVEAVGRRAEELGLGVRDAVASPLPGPSGNVEYFLRLHAGERSVGGWEQRVADVVHGDGVRT